MGTKSIDKQETKKPTKKPPNPTPGRKREDFSQAAARIVREATEGK